MGECTHPRSQGYTDEKGRSRCGACGDRWSDTDQRWYPVNDDGEFLVQPAHPRVVIVDIRNGKVYADGTNLTVPEEGREAVLRAIETADVLVEVWADGVFVKEGVDRGVVTLVATKSEAQMSAEKADREKLARAHPSDDLEVGDHPVGVKFRRVWGG